MKSKIDTLILETTKPTIDTLVLETTRQCNMRCLHCLRGNAEALDMSLEIAIEAINKFSSIGNITFSGGEPTLRADLIEAVVNYIIENKIDVQSFYVASNGKEVSMQTMIALARLYGYIAESGYDTELCQFDVSLDQYHDKIAAKNMNILQAFSFVTHRNPIPQGGLINEGRASDNGIGCRNLHRYIEFTVDDDFDEPRYDMAYVNVKGNILPGCDFSFATQDELSDVNITDGEDFAELAQRYNESLSCK